MTGRTYLVEFVKRISGQKRQIIIPYYLLDICKDNYEAAALLNQILHWMDITPRKDKWYAQSYEDITKELRISKFRAMQAAKILKPLGVETQSMISRYHKYARVLHWRMTDKAIAAMLKRSIEEGVLIPQSEETSLHDDEELNALIDKSLEKNLKRKDKDIAHASASASVDPSPSSSALEGIEKSAQAEHSTKAAKKAKGEQHPLQSSAKGSPAPRAKSILAWIIDDVWANRQGARTDADGDWKRLLPVLVGTSKKHDCVEPAATECEVLAFGRWYRYHNPQTSLPMDAKVASWFGRFRLDAEYERRVRNVEREVAMLYHGETPAPTPQASPAPLPAQTQAALDAALAQREILYQRMRGAQ